MKFERKCRNLFYILLLVVLPGITTAQIQVHEEPMHHLVLSNKTVHVLDVMATPGDTSLIHQHSNNYVYVTIKGGTIWVQNAGENGRTLTMPTGFIGGYYENPTQPLVHRFANQSDSLIRLIAIENLSAGNLSDTLYNTLKNEETLIENTFFRVTKISIPPDDLLKVQPATTTVIINLYLSPIQFMTESKHAFSNDWIWVDQGEKVSIQNHHNSVTPIIMVQIKNKH